MSESCQLAFDLFGEVPPTVDEPTPRENAMSEPERAALCESMYRVSDGALYSRTKAEAIRYGHAIGRPDQIEDLEGEANLAVVIASKNFHADRGAEFCTYATAVIRRMFSRFASMLDAAEQTESWDRIAGPGDGAEDEDDGDDMANLREPNEYQSALLGKLSEQTRQLVQLVAFEGLTPGAAGERLGMNVKDVKLQMRNAARTLGKVVDSEESGVNLFDQLEGD